MQALIVIDAQNEFSKDGKRPANNFFNVTHVIGELVEKARTVSQPIAWVQHYNRPGESPAFIPGTWGADLYKGFGPQNGNPLETKFEKTVYGAFTGTGIGEWLKQLNVDTVKIVGFFTHMCVSTTAREALMAGLNVILDPAATGACSISHEILGSMSADDVERSSLLQLVNMGVVIEQSESISIGMDEENIGRQ